MKNIKNNRRRKIRVAVLFGGKSAEHEISILSARNIVQALDTNKYDIRLIGIDKNGTWLPVHSRQLATEDRILLEDEKISRNDIVPYTNHGTFLFQKKDGRSVDVVFPILHGPMGEDGAMQGLLKLANVPFVGAGVLGSAVGMDKDIMKRLLRDAGIPVAKFLVFRNHEQKDINFQLVEKNLGLPFFVKPANLGSSVGISKVKNEAEFKEAIEKAFSYDGKILIEENISGREIECSVLGNDKPRASVPGEVIPNHEFYSYEAKYLDENGAALKIPAKLSKKLIKKIQNLAVKSFKSLNCEGMARVDFFVKTDGEIYVNEINTIPGFTAISMYPKLWEASGISYAKLVDTLIQLAIERFKKEDKLLTSRK